MLRWRTAVLGAVTEPHAVRRLLAALGRARRATAGAARPRLPNKHSIITPTARCRGPGLSAAPAGRVPGSFRRPPIPPSPCRPLRRALHSGHRDDAATGRTPGAPGRGGGRQDMPRTVYVLAARDSTRFFHNRIGYWQIGARAYPGAEGRRGSSAERGWSLPSRNPRPSTRSARHRR
jgi:hypothetical protein